MFPNWKFGNFYNSFFPPFFPFFPFCFAKGRKNKISQLFMNQSSWNYFRSFDSEMVPNCFLEIVRQKEKYHKKIKHHHIIHIKRTINQQHKSFERHTPILKISSFIHVGFNTKKSKRRDKETPINKRKYLQPNNSQKWISHQK